MKLPSLGLCIGVTLLRLVAFATAWFMVPIGMLIGTIKKGNPVFGQWNGSYSSEDGTMVTGHTVGELLVTPGLWSIYDMPDEPGIGLYEPTVAKIFRKCGWWVTVYYQLAFRNVGQGVAYGWHIDLDDSTVGPYNDDATRLTRTCGIAHGWKVYQDWRKYPRDAYPQDGARRWYAVPTVGAG